MVWTCNDVTARGTLSRRGGLAADLGIFVDRVYSYIAKYKPNVVECRDG